MSLNLNRVQFVLRDVEDQHYVCVVNPDQPNPERVRRFSVKIDVEEGEHDAGENILADDSGYVPTAPLKSDQRFDQEQAPKKPRDVANEKVAQIQVIRMTRTSYSTEHPRTGEKPFVST